MNILYSDEFKKQFNKLPINIQRLYRRQESIFRNNWRDSRLHTKKLVNHSFHFSFRVTRNYRALFAFIENEIAFFATISHRKNSYK